MSELIRVLVTAVGGDLGQALVKALRLSPKPIVCYGCDMDGTGIGSAFVDGFHVVPRADDTTYVEILNDLCYSLQVHAVVPGSEPEIEVLSRLGSPPKLPCGIPIVCQEASFIDIYGDKLRCMEALSQKVNLAPFADGDDRQAVEEIIRHSGFPLVVKSRRSSGSRTLRVAHTQEQLATYLAEIPWPLVQEYIEDTEGEFSVGVFVCEQFSSAIAFKRELGVVGCSWFAETSDDLEVLDYACQVASASQLRGSANVQVRKSKDGVRLLEINTRFSSLVAARAICGFRDAEWSVELALGKPPSRPESDYKQIRFQRFFHELVDFGHGFLAVNEWSPRQVSAQNKEVIV